MKTFLHGSARKILPLLFGILASTACKTDPIAPPESELQSTPTPAPSAVDPTFQAYLDILDLAGTKDFLSMNELSAVYRTSIEHPVARLDVLPTYDPDGSIGFCFGRAMTTHLVSKKSGLKNASLYKIFVMGDLRSAGHTADYPEWYFHVTTIAQGPKNKWYAIDPIMHDAGTPFVPLTAAQWMKRVTAGWDATHGRTAKAKFYIVDANVIMPDIRNLPDFKLETGAQLIETIFNPATQGIVHADAWSKTLGLPKSISSRSYTLSSDQFQQHFLHTIPGTATTFDFFQVNVGTQIFPYKNYFVDLLNSSLDPVASKAPGALSLAGTSVDSSNPKTPPATKWKGGLSYRR